MDKTFSPRYFREGLQDLNSEHELLEFYDSTKEFELVLYMNKVTGHKMGRTTRDCASLNKKKYELHTSGLLGS